MNTIKSRLVTWTFSISIISFLLFFIIAYSFSLLNKVVFAGIPFFIMSYSVILVILSIYMGKHFEIPFKNLANNIEIFMLKKKHPIENKFYIEEFVFLEKFILNAFKVNEEKDLVTKKLGTLAAQVAHDIRSPLAALQVLTEQQLSELKESKRILLRNSVDQIRDIINNLDQNSFIKKETVTQIAILLEHVLSERRMAFNDKSITINENFEIEAYGLFVNALPSEIKRVLTNIINNAVESIQHENGVIDVNLHKEVENIVISIKDNGIGIPQHIVDSLFQRGFTTKKTGSGLGLFHAKETISQWGGSIKLNSIIDQGTTMYITLPSQIPPPWFVNYLSLPNHSIVTCVDDSVSIWNAWQERFKSTNSTIELRYCKDKTELLLELGKEEISSYTYLVDYEFSGQQYTGLDLIEKIISYKKPADQVFLVTSRSGEDIQKFCTEHGIFIISKFFALKIPIIIN